MKDRFDLETEITKLHVFAEDIQDICEHFMNLEDCPANIQDDMYMAFMGVKARLEIHANKMHDTMSQCFKLDKYKAVTYD